MRGSVTNLLKPSFKRNFQIKKKSNLIASTIRKKEEESFAKMMSQSK